MGVVYVAEQLSTGRLRALKLMRLATAGEDDVRRFEREAKVGALIQSEHIVDVIAAGVDAESNCPWLAMELLEGSPLSQYVEQQKQLSLAEASSILRQICAGLSAAHAVRVVHRDIKPDNVFLARSSVASAGYTVKLLDFGIAKLVDGGSLSTKTIGSPFWMAPEQTEPSAELSCATDVWPIALLAFYLLTGRYYWLSANAPRFEVAAFLRELLVDPLPDASERANALKAPALPPWFDAWFARCLSRDPAQRLPDAGEAWRAFEAALTGTQITGRASERPLAFPGADTVVASAPPASLAPPSSAPQPPTDAEDVRATVGTIAHSPRRRRATGLLVLIGVLIAAAGAWLVLPTSVTAPPSRVDAGVAAPGSAEVVLDPPPAESAPPQQTAEPPSPAGAVRLDADASDGPDSGVPLLPKNGSAPVRRAEPSRSRSAAPSAAPEPRSPGVHPPGVPSLPSKPPPASADGDGGLPVLL